MNLFLYLFIFCSLLLPVSPAVASQTAKGSPEPPVTEHLLSVQSKDASNLPPLQLTEQEQAWLKEHPVLRLGYDIDWAPVEYADEQGQYKGITADYMALIAELLQVTFEPAPPQSWQATVKAARSGQLDLIAAITKTPQREEYLQFTSPYLSFPMVILTNMDVSYISNITMLAGKKIAVVQNYVTHETLIHNHPELDLLLVKDIKKGIMAVQQGDAYAFIDGFATVSHILGHQETSDLKVSGELPYSFELAIAVPKGQTVLAGILQKALNGIPQDKKDEIFKRWVSIIYTSDFDFTLIWQLLGVMLLILMTVLYWNHKLRIEISGRQKAEEELLKLSLAVDQSHSTIVITDRDGNIEFVNPAFTLSTGYTKEEAIGQNPRLLKSDHHDQNFYLKMWETLEAGKVWRGEVYNRRKDGSCYWELATISPVRNSEGLTTHYVAIKEDISKSKAAARELEEAVATAKEMTRKSKEANQAKSSFLANMTHELRTPLNVILGFSRLLERDPQINADQLENLKVIHRSGDHLLALINDILDLSKIESGKVACISSSFNLIDFLHDIKMLFKQRCSEKHLLFTLELDPEIPRFISTDKGKLRQVLFNLLGNAINYTSHGSVTMQVTKAGDRKLQAEAKKKFTTAEPTLWLRFAIIDTGIGIEPGDREKIFKPFVQAESRPVKSGGTGLGLSISSNFVRLMGSTLEVSSEKGVGSTFWFDLPVTVIHEVDTRENKTSEYAFGLMAEQHDNKILVVEDQRESRLMLAKFLRSLGFTVQEAANGKEAVTVNASFHPDLVLMDINMPVMDGLTATKEIKAAAGEASPPVIALTAHAFAEERQEMKAAGCDDFIAKPFEETVLLEALKRHLGVQFSYETKRISEEELTSTMLTDLPESQIRELQAATAELNQQRTLECIQQIRKINHNVANLLKVMVDHYRFDDIRVAIEKLYQAT